MGFENSVLNARGNRSDCSFSRLLYSLSFPSSAVLQGNSSLMWMMRWVYYSWVSALLWADFLRLRGKERENPVGDLAALLPFALLAGLSGWLYKTENHAESFWPIQSDGEGRNVGREVTVMAAELACNCLPRASAVCERFDGLCGEAALCSVHLHSRSAQIFREHVEVL